MADEIKIIRNRDQKGRLKERVLARAHPQEEWFTLSELDKITTDGPAGFDYQHFALGYQKNSKWHFSSKFILTLIVKNHGFRTIGDNFAPYHEGTLVLLGPHLLHQWRALDAPEKTFSISISFHKDFPGKDFSTTTEMRHISKLLERASQGIQFFAPTRHGVAKKILSLPKYPKFGRVLKLLEILDALAASPSYKLLSKRFSVRRPIRHHSARIRKVLLYLRKRFRRNITQAEVAQTVSMTSPAFSRFFKKVMGETFSSFLNQIRINDACYLLMGEKQRIIDICYRCGYNNLSHFNNQFLKLKGMSPSQFRSNLLGKKKQE